MEAVAPCLLDANGLQKHLSDLRAQNSERATEQVFAWPNAPAALRLEVLGSEDTGTLVTTYDLLIHVDSTRFLHNRGTSVCIPTDDRGCVTPGSLKASLPHYAKLVRGVVPDLDAATLPALIHTSCFLGSENLLQGTLSVWKSRHRCSHLNNDIHSKHVVVDSGVFLCSSKSFRDAWL